MKLKEKLAQKWIRANTGIGYEGILLNPADFNVETAAEKAYLAGFEKAQEMAKSVCYQAQLDIEFGHGDSMNRKQDELDTQYNMGCWECGAAISRLGEEEV